MNFSPQVKAWLMLVTKLLGTSLTIGYTAFLSGASVWGSVVVGSGQALLCVYFALSESPQDKSVPTTP